MKPLLLIAWLLSLVASAPAATTINSVQRHAYGGNIGWIDARGNGSQGAVIGEYVCSGFLWGANVGWIHLGNGTPTNGVRYQNAAVGDYGVNHDGLGNLRGYAYGANIGWLHFENQGAPTVDLKSGNLRGHVWSGNCGWISLSNAFSRVQTDVIQPGLDSDLDGITDAWELSYTNTLVAFTATSDSDQDGVSDQAEHAADTDPFDPNDLLRITGYDVAFMGGNNTNTLRWSSKVTRCYVVRSGTELKTGAGLPEVTPIIPPDPGPATQRAVSFAPASSQRFFQIQAVKPLAP